MLGAVFSVSSRHMGARRANDQPCQEGTTISLAVTRVEALVSTLHPGTVGTRFPVRKNLDRVSRQPSERREIKSAVGFVDVCCRLVTV